MHSNNYNIAHTRCQSAQSDVTRDTSCICRVHRLDGAFALQPIGPYMNGITEGLICFSLLFIDISAVQKLRVQGFECRTRGAPARMLGSNGSGGRVSTMYMSVTVISVTAVAESYAGDASTRAAAAVRVNPLRGLGDSSIMADSFDWNTPMRAFVIAALNLVKERLFNTQNPQVS
jgi:hypothetical protein